MFAATAIPTIRPCSLGSFLAELDDESRNNLEAALSLSNRDVSHRKISRDILNEADIKIDPETVADHRNGICRCSKI